MSETGSLLSLHLSVMGDRARREIRSAREEMASDPPRASGRLGLALEEITGMAATCSAFTAPAFRSLFGLPESSLRERPLPEDDPFPFPAPDPAQRLDFALGCISEGLRDAERLRGPEDDVPAAQAADQFTRAAISLELASLQIDFP